MSIFFCRRWKIPYYWVGLKAYELLAGRENVEPGYFLTKTKALEAFPMLKKDKIVGALVYYDGESEKQETYIVWFISTGLILYK